MDAKGIFPNLGAVGCAQLTFGADIRLSASQVGAIRDSVLAQFPTASIPPWYFGELYRWNDDTYEVAASISSSTKSDPMKAYSAFFRIQRLGDGRIDGPSIHELLRMLGQQEDVVIYCTSNFVRDKGSGEPYGRALEEIYRDEYGKLMMESYTTGIYDESDGRLGSAEVRRIGDESVFYSISFSQEGTFSLDFADRLLSRAVSLFRRVHHESVEGGEVER